MAGTAKNRLIGCEPLCPDDHGHKTRRPFDREDHEAHATLRTRIGIRRVDVCGIRHTRIISSLHLRSTERHGLLCSLCITCAEKRSEGLLVAILPRLKCCRVDDVYESIEIDYGPK
jgi:hypothetical protein